LLAKPPALQGRLQKTATKEAAGAIKRNIVDEATKPLKEAAKKKASELTESVRSKAEAKVREAVKEQVKKDVKKKLFRK